MPPAKTSTSHRNKSICQKSGEIAVTLTKISSLYLATFLLPRNRKPAGKREPSTPTEVRRLAAYVKEPDDAVDARADEYIRRRRAGVFSHIDDGVRNEALDCIPPPPPPKNKWVAGAGGGGGGYRRMY